MQGKHWHSHPPLQVDIKYAATVHAFWSIELNVCKTNNTPARALAHRQLATATKKKHTQPHVKLQSGATIWAAAKPDKRSNDASGATRGDISCPTTEGGTEGKRGARHSKRRRRLLIDTPYKNLRMASSICSHSRPHKRHFN